MTAPTTAALLPALLDARKMCAQNAEITGSVPVSALPGLLDALLDDSGTVLVRLDFSRDERHRRVMQGNLSTRVKVECQRCLGEMDLVLEENFAIGLVETDEQAKLLPETLDPFLAPEGQLDTRLLLAEQLLLGMPLVSRHEEGACTGPAKTAGEESTAPRPDTTEGEQETHRPFEILKSLLDQENRH